MQRRLRGEAVEREGGEALGGVVVGAGGRQAGAGVERERGEERGGYKFAKMSRQREAEGSAEGAGEGDEGEGGGAEGASVAPRWWRRDLVSLELRVRRFDFLRKEGRED